MSKLQKLNLNIQILPRAHQHLLRQKKTPTNQPANQSTNEGKKNKMGLLLRFLTPPIPVRLDSI